MTDDAALRSRVLTAHGDAWQAEGRLRRPFGGDATEVAGARLMASGLPWIHTNAADVTDAADVSLDELRDWYAARAVPWGAHVPAGQPWTAGRHVFRKRCMGLLSDGFHPSPPVDGVTIRDAGPEDAPSVGRVDAVAFDATVDQTLPWLFPRLGATNFTVALALWEGEPVATATAVRTSDRAGECVGIFGVAVVPAARRRGIGAALTSHLLTAGFSSGATLGHLHPDTDEAARLYSRLGFSEVPGLDVYVDL